MTTKIFLLTLNRLGNDLRRHTLIDKPMSVAMLQCGIVGVKCTDTEFSLLLMHIKSS